MKYIIFFSRKRRAFRFIFDGGMSVKVSEILISLIEHKYHVNDDDKK